MTFSPALIGELQGILERKHGREFSKKEAEEIGTNYLRLIEAQIELYNNLHTPSN